MKALKSKAALKLYPRIGSDDFKCTTRTPHERLDMTYCNACASGLSGAYNFSCITCCAKIVRDSRPSKDRQETMLYLIDKFRKRSIRDDVLADIKRLDKVEIDKTKSSHKGEWA